MDNKPNKIQLNNQKMIEREELDKLNNYNPFGKGGSGAPIRDYMGNIVTVRKTIAGDNGFEPRLVSGKGPDLNMQTRQIPQQYGIPIATPNMPITSANNIKTPMGYNMHNTMPMTYMPHDNFQSKYFYNYNDYSDPRLGRLNNMQYGSNTPYQREPTKENIQPFLQSRTIQNNPINIGIPEVQQIEEPKIPQNSGFSQGSETEMIHNKKLYYQTILKQQIEEKRQRDEMRKKQDEEMDKLEEMKYNEYLYY